MSVFKSLSSVFLSDRPFKCYIAYSSLEVLGHISGTDRLLPNLDKIQAIKTIIGRQKKQVRSLAEF